MFTFWWSLLAPKRGVQLAMCHLKWLVCVWLCTQVKLSCICQHQPVNTFPWASHFLVSVQLAGALQNHRRVRGQVRRTCCTSQKLRGRGASAMLPAAHTGIHEASSPWEGQRIYRTISRLYLAKWRFSCSEIKNKLQRLCVNNNVYRGFRRIYTGKVRNIWTQNFMKRKQLFGVQVLV